MSKHYLSILLLVYSFAVFGQSNEPPVLLATGNQVFCQGSALPIVTSMSITDPDDSATDAVYIQISSGYVQGQDSLTLTGTHPNITTSWDANAGKLRLSNPAGNPVSYSEFVSAVEAVTYSNSAANASGTRTFSITVGQANYLPSTDHYYRYIQQLGITWTAAKAAAESSSYYGLQGYLATLLSDEEAQLCGEQTSGAGWIGGSDAQNEGVWQWVTGPEAGDLFWYDGTVVTFAFWNSGEPNNAGDEDYAHITAPGVGIPGSWNDLSNTGADSGDYQPKGYIVEYGGMPGDPALNISTSSTITIPSVTDTTPASLCGPGSATLSANAENGTITWYDNATGGTALATGEDFTTPVVNETTTYYVDAYEGNCPGSARKPVELTIRQIPVVTVTSIAPSCGEPVTLEAETTAGVVRWYDAPTGGTLLATGNTFTTPLLEETTSYYVEGDNDGCLSTTRTELVVGVYEKPEVSDVTTEICPGSTIDLDASIDNVTYFWPHSEETTKVVTISAAGTYTVIVTSPAPENCSATKTFTVEEIQVPVISNIITEGLTATVELSSTGDYEYSLDDINYGPSNVLNVFESGVYTAFVREVSGCGKDSQEFTIGMIPPYFTPNGDGHNDTWSIRGMLKYPEISIHIFDRAGKLVSSLDRNHRDWDGNYNGRPSPANDYWFIMKLASGTAEIRGHFSLLR